MAHLPELVELRVDAVAHEAAFAHQERRLVDEGGLDVGGNPQRRVEVLELPAHEGGGASVDGLGRGGQRPQRAGEGDEVARRRGAERDPADDPVQVLHALEGLAQAAALHGAEGELLHRVEAVLDRLHVDEGTEDPLAQEP